LRLAVPVPELPLGGPIHKIIPAAPASTPIRQHFTLSCSAMFPQGHAEIGIHAAPKEAPRTFLKWRRLRK